MKLLKLDYLSFFLIFIISLLFTLELFWIPGRPATFDSNTHITTLTQFGEVLKSGDFPVVWLNNFANYGLPVGIFTHQLTNYLGGVIVLFTQNPTLTYNLLLFSAVFLSGIFFYSFLRIYFSPIASFLGILVLTFTPYRIFSVYIRGAMPEVFSGIFIPLILLAIYLFIVRKKIYGLFLLIISVAALTLNHPMMLVVYSFLFIPYLIFLLLTSKLSKTLKIKMFLFSALGITLGALLCSYYILPLNLEIKYFYFGQGGNHFVNDYLSLTNFLGTQWQYFSRNDIFTRAHLVPFGLLESVILLSGLIYFLYQKFLKKAKENLDLLGFVLVISLLTIFLTTPLAGIFFEKIFFLNNIQFPWRFLSGLILLPPIVVAFLYDRYPKKILFFLLIIVVPLLSFSQIYGKNFTIYPNSSYYSSKENLYSIMMNTVWTGRSEDYPAKINQAAIIEGKGKIIDQKIKNSARKYLVNAETPLEMVDRTFYFPGWNVYIDGVKTNIEFQNPQYRGVITYQMPVGKHNVYIAFEDTKVRLFAKILSLSFLVVFVALLPLKRKIKQILQ